MLKIQTHQPENMFFPKQQLRVSLKMCKGDEDVVHKADFDNFLLPLAVNLRHPRSENAEKGAYDVAEIIRTTKTSLSGDMRKSF